MMQSARISFSRIRSFSAVLSLSNARAAADAIDVDAEVAQALRRSTEHEARSLSDSSGDSERAIGTASLARERFAANVLSEGRSLDESVDAFE